MMGRIEVRYAGRPWRGVKVKFRSRLARMLPGGGITLSAGCIRLKRLPWEVPAILISHEVVHVEQAVRHGWTYLFRYCGQALRHGWKGKRFIPMEQEAYDRQKAVRDGVDVSVTWRWVGRL